MDWTAPAGLIAVGLLLCGVFLRYPRGAIPGGAGPILASGVALAVFAAWAVLTWRGSRRPAPAFRNSGRQFGVAVGLGCGALWVLEISFNNFVDPSLSTASSRLYVDDGTWALVAVLILLASFRIARRGGFGSGVRVGAWSGFVSGLVSCLMALVLVNFLMPFLLRDPLNIEEYKAQTNAPDMATYFAYETTAGALGHLLVLGCAMGALLGAAGGALGSLMRVRTPAP